MKKKHTEKTVFYAVAFDQLRFRHFSFVKDVYAVGKKMTRSGCKIDQLIDCLFWIESEYKQRASLQIDGTLNFGFFPKILFLECFYKELT